MKDLRTTIGVGLVFNPKLKRTSSRTNWDIPPTFEMQRDMRGPVPGQIDVHECVLKEVGMFHPYITGCAKQRAKKG